MTKMNPVIVKILKVAGGVAAGALLGFLYYKVIGCRTGTCPLTSSALRSSIYGAAIGLLAGFV